MEHAQNVLNILGIADQFADIVDVRRVEYVSKPNAEAYARLLAILHATGDECILIEDSVRNLLPGKALGMTTILVDSPDCAEVDFCVPDILSVKSIVNELLAQEHNRVKR